MQLWGSGVQLGATTTGGSGAYSFSDLLPGAYLVREVQPVWLRFSTTSDEIVVAVVNGQQAEVNFGDWKEPRKTQHRLW